MGIVIWVLAMVVISMVRSAFVVKSFLDAHWVRWITEEPNSTEVLVGWLAGVFVGCLSTFPIGAIVWAFLWDFGDQPQTAVLFCYPVVAFILHVITQLVVKKMEKAPKPK